MGRKRLLFPYEGYEPMALKEINRLLDFAMNQWPIQRACILHRLGEVPLAQASVLTGVAAPHRPEAFDACRFLIDHLKQQVPIWKQERFAEGKKIWVQGINPPEIPNS